MSRKKDKSDQPIIYVVDDDVDIRSIVASALLPLGGIIEEFGDGTAVLNRSTEQPPALVILDIMMPGMDGNETCRRLRALPGGEYIQILMLTARESVQDKIESLDEGADDYVTKPFNYQELAARARALLRVHEVAAQLQKKNELLETAREQIVAQERQLAVVELAGAAAHELGQPIAAILLNCHLLEKLPPEDQNFKVAVAAIKNDARRMTEIVEGMKKVDAARKSSYHGKSEILELHKDEDN